MATVLRFLAGLIGFALLLAGCAAAYVYLASNKQFDRKHAIELKPLAIPTGAEAVARGAHLAKTRGCVDCHGSDLGGAKIIDDPAMGVIHGSNLTPGRGSRTAEYQDADWIRAIRHGVSRERKALFLMPSQEYAEFSNADLGALIAYLKTVPAVDRDTVPVKPGPVARALLVAGKVPLAAAVIDHANVKPSTVSPGVAVEYGRYLAVGCIGCHGPNHSGGKIEAGPPDWPHAANLTPHATSKVSKWKEADFLSALRTGKRPDGTEINPVMPRAFGGMTDEELKAIWMYLRTLPPVEMGKR